MLIQKLLFLLNVAFRWSLCHRSVQRSRPVISVLLVVSVHVELVAKAAVTSESQHVALYTPSQYVPVPPSLWMCVFVHYSLFPSPFPCLLSSVLFFRCSKLEWGQALVLCLSLQSLMTQHPSVLGSMRKGWGGGLSVLSLLARLVLRKRVG